MVDNSEIKKFWVTICRYASEVTEETILYLFDEHFQDFSLVKSVYYAYEEILTLLMLIGVQLQQSKFF